jgi:protein-L-isoaspartate(D-aspartate) O-methyltransferase
MPTDRDSTPSTSAELIELLRRQGIANERVLQAIAATPRDRFVPPELLPEAWHNKPLPIGLEQTISQPSVVALMTDALDLSGNEHVLEIGTGSGYQAAVLSHLAADIVTVERQISLAESARERLAALGIRNVRVVIGDGSQGWTTEEPYDRIIVTAASPSLPQPLLAQLNDDGGRLVIPVGTPDEQELVFIERRGPTYARHPLGPVRFVPLVGKFGWEIDG